MNVSPAIRSAISPDYLAEFVRDKYGLGRDTSCRVIKLGVNDTYLIKAK